MRRTFVVTLALGLLVTLFGLTWALQGFGVLGGSPMSNTTTWSIIGPITVAIGIVIVVFSWRKISSK
jgi:predicted RND superfamily exporter protein